MRIVIESHDKEVTNDFTGRIYVGREEVEEEIERMLDYIFGEKNGSREEE